MTRHAASGLMKRLAQEEADAGFSWDDHLPA